MSLTTTFKNLAPNPNFAGVHDVEPQEILVLKDNGGVKIIDVRGQDEFIGELGHIPGADLIVLDTLPQNAPKVPRSEPVVIVCRSGGRSAKACAFLQSQGYDNVVNMRGGMLLWNQLQFPTEK
ncbi:MAG: rhodanese-like domain-containing protein [Bdellovibrionota bacterium]